MKLLATMAIVWLMGGAGGPLLRFVQGWDSRMRPLQDFDFDLPIPSPRLRIE